MVCQLHSGKRKNSRGSPKWLRRLLVVLYPHWRTFMALTASGEPTPSWRTLSTWDISCYSHCLQADGTGPSKPGQIDWKIHCHIVFYIIFYIVILSFYSYTVYTVFICLQWKACTLLFIVLGAMTIKKPESESLFPSSQSASTLCL